MLDRIKIIKGDITTFNVDAVVNAANKRLKGGSGVCGAIFKVAGWNELQKECDSIGGYKTGSAVITKGYKLKAKYIIHAVGPVYRDDSSAPYLKSTYESILKLADEYNIESIAIPSISTGIYGYPKEKAVKIALDVIINSRNNIKKIVLVCFDETTYKLYKHELNEYKGCV